MEGRFTWGKFFTNSLQLHSQIQTTAEEKLNPTVETGRITQEDTSYYKTTLGLKSENTHQDHQILGI